MKVTITDPKQVQPHLTVADLPPGTLFELYTEVGAHYIGMIVRDKPGVNNNVVRLNGNPTYTVPVKTSHYKNKTVHIINSVELSTK